MRSKSPIAPGKWARYLAKHREKNRGFLGNFHMVSTSLGPWFDIERGKVEGWEPLFNWLIYD